MSQTKERSLDAEPELRCFGNQCTPSRVFGTQQEAASHENTRHGGAQTVFSVVPTADGMGWAES